MIVIKLELWPYGDEMRKSEIGRAYVWNDGTGTARRGNYQGAIMRKGVENPPQLGGKTTKTGELKDYPRLTYSVWVLIQRFLNAAIPGK